MASAVITVEKGSMVNYQRELHPDMLKRSGLKVPSAIEGIQLKFDRKYVLDKIKHDVINALGIKSKDELENLLNEAYEK